MHRTQLHVPAFDNYVCWITIASIQQLLVIRCLKQPLHHEIDYDRMCSATNWAGHTPTKKKNETKRRLPTNLSIIFIWSRMERLSRIYIDIIWIMCIAYAIKCTYNRIIPIMLTKVVLQNNWLYTSIKWALCNRTDFDEWGDIFILSPINFPAVLSLLHADVRTQNARHFNSLPVLDKYVSD